MVTEQNVVEKILRTLSPKFDYLVVGIEESKDIKMMKVEELHRLLEAHELKLLSQIVDRGVKEHALQAEVSTNTG